MVRVVPTLGRSFWCALFGLTVLTTPACAAGRDAPVRAPEPAPLTEAEPYSVGDRERGLADICELEPAACVRSAQKMAMRDSRLSQATIQLTRPLAAAPAVGRLRSYRTAEIAQMEPAAPAAIPLGSSRSARAELLDVEARLSIEVKNVSATRKAVTEIVSAFGGQVVNEVEANDDESRGASLSIRVPSRAVHALLARLSGIGRLLSQRVETREISRTLNDAEILQKNLENALNRYQELLASAANVTEVLAIEAELQRVRTSLERVRGDIEWMRDRTVRSTVYVTLSLADQELDRAREVKVHPGLRGSALFDLPPAAGGRAFLSAGLSLAWSRSFNLDLDLMKRLDHDERGTIDALLLSAGSEFYSDFLGRGRRRWLNPYFGLRVGYAHLLTSNALLVGGSLGLEVFKSRFLSFEVQSRSYALIGPNDGVHIGLQPGAVLSFAY